MSKVITCQYGESIEVDNFGTDNLALRCDTVEPILDKAQCENLAATIVGMSGVYDGRLNFRCNSGDMQELSTRPSNGGNVNLILSDHHGAGYLGEVFLTPQDAMALAFELIRMATHE
jgi:hypothetical protein